MAKPGPSPQERVEQALQATRARTGRMGLVERALLELDDDERAAWDAVLRDRSIPAQHVHRAMRYAGLNVGSSDANILTWRATHAPE
jgi:hypothetical protein